MILEVARTRNKSSYN